MEDGVEPLLLLAAGMQMNLPAVAVGLELNSRTLIDDIDMVRDPLWITPSMQFRTGYNLNLSVGGDISLSEDRRETPAERALEPYRLFGGLAFTFDTHEEKRRQERDEAWRRTQEKRRLQLQAIELAKQAREDSLRAAEASVQVNTMNIQNQALTEKARQDSLALAENSSRDSLALAEAERKLALERSRRSEMENQLLTTGLLVMDAVYFETARTDISINSKPYLDMLAKLLTKYPKLRIEVAGHTDNVGSDAYNMGLSQGRAASVQNHLIMKEPSLSDKLTARGYGESSPKADNATAEGRMRNRRTELQVLNKEALREYNEPISEQARGDEAE
jgi:outer membrane protein OmpA-like peptidoglycan-associated protein